MRKNCQHGQSRWKGTGRQPSQGGDGCDGTCQPQHPNMTNMVIKRLGSGGGGIFTVQMLTFSGKSAEKVMGVNGFDCPDIFLGAGVLNF